MLTESLSSCAPPTQKASVHPSHSRGVAPMTYCGTPAHSSQTHAVNRLHDINLQNRESWGPPFSDSNRPQPDKSLPSDRPARRPTAGYCVEIMRVRAHETEKPHIAPLSRYRPLASAPNGTDGSFGRHIVHLSGPPRRLMGGRGAGGGRRCSRMGRRPGGGRCGRTLVLAGASVALSLPCVYGFWRGLGEASPHSIKSPASTLR